MTKVLSLRVADDLAEWADVYAKERGVTRQALLEEGLRSFKEDCEKGVPEIRAAAARQSSVRAAALVGVCPENARGHEFVAPTVDPERPCAHCGFKGRQNHPVGEAVKPEPNHLSQASADRSALFSRLRVPMQSGTGDPKKVK